LTHSDGLSSHRVFTIIEDQFGGIWISTKAGVDRYNGHSIKNYKLTGDFYFGDMAGRTIQLFQSKQGDIWAYDNTGRIYKYSPIYDRFDIEMKLGEFIHENIMLNKYTRGQDGKQLFGLTKGLYIKDKSGHLQPIIKGVVVNDMTQAGNLWFIATSSGLGVLTNKWKMYMLPSFESRNIQTLYYDKETAKLMIGTFNDGLWILDTSTRKLSHVNSKNDIFTNPIRSILKLSANTMVIGIDGSGIYTVDIQNNKVELLINTEDHKGFSLHGNGIYALLKDRQGNLWAGSYTGGVSLIALTDSPCRLITHERGNNNSLANDNVNSIAENINGDIWYATDRGVSIFQNSGQWTHTLNKYVGVTLCPSGNGSMLLGTYGEGIFILDKNGKAVKLLNKQSGNLTSNYIFSIKKDHSGDYWVGALDGELMNLDENGKLKQRYPVNLVLSITVIDENRIAAATVDGFYIVNKNKHSIERYASSQEQIHNNISAYIIPMLFNADGTVWLGTEGGGLNLYDVKTRKILRSYKSSDGLPSNDIYSIQSDSKGRLWVSTGNGVAIINDSAVLSLSYLKGVEKEYNKSASIRLKCGDFIFGGISGAVRFSPSEINLIDYTAPLRITGFTIDGISESKRDKLIFYIHRGLENGQISLAYKQNTFTVNFESINLRYQEDIAYRYILEGYDKGWSDISVTGSATYKNVTPGKYLLRICSVRKSDGKLINQKKVEIVVSHPWWSSWWAWIGYAVLLGMTGYFIFRYKWYQLQKQHNEDKIRFFVNTAHDIRTPVTLVMAPLDDLRKEEHLSSNAIYLLDMARQNIRKLNNITTRLLEFEKIDTDNHHQDLDVIDVRDILREEIGCFQNVCDKKNIQLSLTLPHFPACILGDNHLLEMIFDNLISNACKYTKAGGSIHVVLSATKNKVTAEIIDSGIGIPQSEHKHTFSKVFRAQNALETQEIGTGFGLIQVKRIVKILHGTIEFKSVEGEGTTFTVSFKRVYEEAITQPRQTPANSLADDANYSSPSKIIDSDHNKDVTILIVEDNDDLRQYLGNTFSAEYNVVLMPTADDALSYLSDEYPDLIVSDVMMPGTQGDDFCSAVKNNPETAGIPVILLTAKAGHDAIVTGLRKGADDYIAKPFSTEILKLKVQGAIENRNRLRNYLLKQAVNKVTSENTADALHIAEEKGIEPELSISDRKFMERVTEIVVSNMANTNFTIEILCREMAMSRTLLYGRLKSLTGKAPQEFIRLLCLERAADLLRQGMSVTDAAEATGFINAKYFSTVFKKQFGVQPSKFIKKE
jgi:DNA-binding response OmpR family regulator/ligand-binding sensor domain-containing protein/two-component sensor histidine kinase